MNCKYCENEFIIKCYNQLYCSDFCRLKAKNKRLWSIDKVKIVNLCSFCKNSFLSSKIRTYCSRACISKGTCHKRKKYLDIPECLDKASRKLDKIIGYVRVYAPMHKEANTWGYVYEHRLIAEKMLNRSLFPNEIVHHKNGKRWDNREENLEVMDKNEHAKLHGQRKEDIISTNLK